MEKAADVLKRIAEPSPVSRQLVRRAEGIELIRFKREQGQQTLAFSSRPFILCGLPLRRPPGTQLIYERRNGRFLLLVTGHPEFGLPFGQDRLVPTFLATVFFGTDRLAGPEKDGSASQVQLLARGADLVQPIS